MFGGATRSSVLKPGRFDGFHAIAIGLEALLVRFDNNKYLVAASAIGWKIVGAGEVAKGYTIIGYNGFGH